MNNELSVIDLILQASLVVQLVVLLLIGASVLSWAIIFRKRTLIGQARQEADRFEAWFWSGVDLGKLFKSIESRGDATTGMESIFEAGFSEFSRVRSQLGLAPGQSMERIRRAMRVEQLKEIDGLEESLATLATIGSTSPYVGLFGTVWGIMSAFHGLGNVQQATLAMVAPGIAEALIATALGWGAAIPAAIFYNYFGHVIREMGTRMEDFSLEFLNFAERSFGD